MPGPPSSHKKRQKPKDLDDEDEDDGDDSDAECSPAAAVPLRARSPVASGRKASKRHQPTNHSPSASGAEDSPAESDAEGSTRHARQTSPDALHPSGSPSRSSSPVWESGAQAVVAAASATQHEPVRRHLAARVIQRGSFGYCYVRLCVCVTV